MTRQFMRQNWQSNRIFMDFDNIVDLCCAAWRGSQINLGTSCQSTITNGQSSVRYSEDCY
jgi:hypothetical protein